MKKIMKILLANGLSILLLSNTVFAAEGTRLNVPKIVFLVIAGIAIASILYLSYRGDTKTVRAEKKEKKENKKKDTIQEELVEKDTTYEVEDNEFYVDDKIEPVKVAKDEDEISLFESINNPDTLKEDIEEDTSENDNSNIDGTMVFDSSSLNKTEEDVINAIDELDDNVQEEVVNTEENIEDEMLNLVNEDDEENEEDNDSNNDEDSYNYDYDYSEIEEEIEEEKEEEEKRLEEEKKIDIFAKDEEEEDIEEELEEAEEKAEEVNPGFSGFATLGSNNKSKNKVTFERYSDTIKKEEPKEEKTSKKEIVKEDKKEEKISEDSSNDFLAQMELNLSGGNKEEIVESKPAKKTTTKKTTTAKKTTTKKTTTKAAEKKTETKKTTTKKTAKKAEK